MAPINFENQIKDKLEKRYIAPKASSWNALADRLDKEQPKRNNKGFWWVGIAASFIGVLVITTVMFNKNDNETVSPTIVDTENQTIKNDKQVVPTIEEQIQNEKETILTVSETEDLKSDETNKKEDLKELKKPVKAQNQKELQLKEKVIIKQEVKQDKALAQTEVQESPSQSEFRELSLEDQKLNAVVAEIKRLDEANPHDIDNEVNALLREAQREIRLQKLYEKAIETVNADDLLKAVETDLDNSFRDRVFKTLLSSYKEVKTAVANRNN